MLHWPVSGHLQAPRFGPDVALRPFGAFQRRTAGSVVREINKTKLPKFNSLKNHVNIIVTCLNLLSNVVVSS